jgi:sec-independent protein translocase protein TatC
MTNRREEELDEGGMPFFEHLVELRDRVRNSAIAFVIAIGLSWAFSEDIYKWLRGPLDAAWRSHKELGPNPVMSFGSVVEPFWVYFSVSMWAGIFLASPVIFHQIWKFIAPGLYKNERRIGVAFGFFSALFFVCGALFCYYVVLERLYQFMLGYADASLKPTLFMTDYLDITRNTMLAFGGIFELPILIYFLALAGVVTPRSLWRFNRIFVVIAFVVGAILTPSPDVVAQVLMAVPMIALYNLSILAAYFVSKRKAREAAAAEQSAAAEADEAAGGDGQPG